jgi:acetyl-CoA carboxylase biotin carboxyl carrier protein
MTTEEIRELIQVVLDTGIAELEVRRGENSVRIKNPKFADPGIVVPAVLPLQLGTQNPTSVNSPAAPPTEIAAPTAPAGPKEGENDIVVKSPIVGTYYDAPAPGAPPFVKPGDRVVPKQVLCIIESMKLMNEIEAEISGVVIACHVENSRPVEYGESLFTIRPV